MKGIINKRTLTLVFLLLFLTLIVGCFPLINKSPIITSTPITLAEVNELYTYDVNATDPDGDSLTYSLDVKPSGMVINPATGLIKWIPTAKGDYPVVVKVSDGTLDITQSFTIVVSEAEEPGWTPTGTPIITSTPITTATIGVLYAYDVEATDPNGDTLTYSLTTYPSKMTISSANGVIIWVPTLAQVGNNSVVVKVSDGVLSDNQIFTIVVSKPSVPLKTYTITASAGSHGSISPSGAVIVNEGSDKSFIINPDTGYSIEKVFVDGGSVGAVNAYTFNNVAKDHTIYATFSAIEPEPEVELTAELTSLWEDLDADFKPDFAPGVYEYSIAATYVEDKITIAATTDLEGATIEYDYKHTKKGTVMGGCDLFVGKNIITITVKKGGYQTTTYTITVTKEADFLVYNASTGEYFETIQEAIEDSDTVAGHTIYVSAGTYNEQVVINKQLTLYGVNASESIIYGMDSTAVTISADNVTIDGFTLDGGITLDDELNSISGGTISNNIITGADNPADPPKAENGIRLGWDDGIGVNYITIENNIIKNSLCKGIRFACPGPGEYILWGGTTPGNSYITVRKNEIKDNKAGMDTYGPGPNTIIDNIISDNVNAGMNLRFDDGDVVTGNIITNNTGPGITLCQVTNTVVENNSVSGHQDVDVKKEWRGSGIQILKASKYNTIRYNDISGNNYGIFIRSKVVNGALLQSSDNSINFNNIYSNNTYGIFNDFDDPPIPVDATDNWWGHTSGPTHLSTGGAGDVVSDNVTFFPWSESPNF